MRRLSPERFEKFNPISGPLLSSALAPAYIENKYYGAYGCSLTMKVLDGPPWLQLMGHTSNA